MTNRQKMTRYSSGFAFVLAVVVAAAGWAWSDRSDEAPERGDVRSALPVPVRRIKEVDRISRKREFTGVIKAARESRLSFERPGRVIDIRVDEGSRVCEGQLLAKIDVKNVSAQWLASQAQLGQAEAILAELVAGPRAETIAAAGAKVASLEAQVQRLERDFKRSTQLLAAKAISNERFDTVKYQLDIAIAERDAVQKQLDELLAGTRVEQLDAQRAVVKQLESQVEKLRLEVEDGLLRSPFDGTISQRLVDEGTVIEAGAVVLELVEDTTLEAWIGLAPSVGSDVQLGSTYQLEAGGKHVSGVLKSRRPQLDLVTRTQNVVLQIDKANDFGLVPGQIVRLPISEEVSAKGFLLPASALTPGPRGLWKVLVVNDEMLVEQRDVEVLYSLGNESLVAGTLSNGDAVVVDGVHRVVVGQKVAIATNASQETKR